MEVIISASPERSFEIPGLEVSPITIVSLGDTSPSNGAINYHKCLSHSNNDCLIVEDDIVFSEGWFDYLTEAVQSISALHSLFVLSLYTVIPLEKSTVRYVEYPKGRFGGTQAVYYSKLARSRVNNFMEHNCFRKDFRIWDWEIRDFLDQEKIPIFVTVPNLVQHVGKSLIGSPLHTSPNFVEKVDTWQMS